MQVDALIDRPILYIEDDLDTGELVREILSALGYEINVVTNVAKAKEVIDTDQRFLMYLLDIRLPDGNGIDLCRWIRESDSATPIAFYSANPSYSAEAFSAGAQAFVPKSGDIELLESTVQRLAAQR
jgi:DNA-binding response OmpR family regulator